MTETPHLTLDPDKLGIGKGHLVVPKGVDSEALSLPVFSLNKGEGPRLLITGGCHGNELEGPIIARGLLSGCPKRKPVEGSSSCQPSIHWLCRPGVATRRSTA